MASPVAAAASTAAAKPTASGDASAQAERAADLTAACAVMRKACGFGADSTALVLGVTAHRPLSADEEQWLHTVQTDTQWAALQLWRTFAKACDELGDRTHHTRPRAVAAIVWQTLWRHAPANVRAGLNAPVLAELMRLTQWTPFGYAAATSTAMALALLDWSDAHASDRDSALRVDVDVCWEPEPPDPDTALTAAMPWGAPRADGAELVARIAARCSDATLNRVCPQSGRTPLCTALLLAVPQPLHGNVINSAPALALLSAAHGGGGVNVLGADVSVALAVGPATYGTLPPDVCALLLAKRRDVHAYRAAFADVVVNALMSPSVSSAAAATSERTGTTVAGALVGVKDLATLIASYARP